MIDRRIHILVKRCSGANQNKLAGRGGGPGPCARPAIQAAVENKATEAHEGKPPTNEIVASLFRNDTSVGNMVTTLKSTFTNRAL